MTLRIDNPTLFRRNVQMSWQVMAHVVKHVQEQCWVAHLEPNPGVSYDCLSLVVRGKEDRIHTAFMMNRNGINCNRLDRIWAKVAREGHIAIAEQLIEICGLTRSVDPVNTGISQVCDEIVAWIDDNKVKDFYVGPQHWPGACRTYLDIPFTEREAVQWPIFDNGPDLCLGIDRVEVARLVQRQTTSNTKGEN